MIIIVLATLGFTSTIGQVVLMRELVAVFYGNELVFGLILAWWLLWEAAGAWGLGRWAERRGWGRRALTLALTLAALALPLQIVLTRCVRDLLGVTPGAFVPLGSMVWAVGLITALYPLAHGLCFSLGARLLAELRAGCARGAQGTSDAEGAAGRAYTFESAGAVVGGALFSFLLVGWLDPVQVILLVGAVTLVVVARYWILGIGYWILGLVGGVLLALILGGWVEEVTLERQWPNLVYAGDSRYGRLTITALGGQRAFFENGLLAFETESTFPEEVVHLPLLAHPAPQRVLLIGGGVAGDLVELFKHDVDEVVYVELDPLVIQAARVHLPIEQAAVLDDPRLTLVYEDGRRYVKRVGGQRFDVVIVDLPEPSTGQLNRFYTLEFFEEVQALLARDGVFALGLPSAENYWSPELVRRNASVYRTLRQVFPTVTVTPGDHNFLLATTRAALPGAAALGERFEERGIATRWVTPAYIAFLLTGDRFQAVQADLAGAGDVRLNRDLAPICYFYDLALWVSRFGSGLRGLFETTSLLRLGWLAVPLVAGLAALWGRRRAAAPALVGGAGFAGMTLQVTLLLAFQALHGYVYHQVGLLVTAFMAGLALGAGLASARGGGASGLLWVQAGLALYGVFLAAVLPLGPPAPELTFPLLAGVAGALTGAVFPLAAALSGAGAEGHVAALLYGADLVGGCVGALFTSAVLVPVLGVVQTCLVVTLVAAAGMALALSVLVRREAGALG